MRNDIVLERRISFPNSLSNPFSHLSPNVGSSAPQTYRAVCSRSLYPLLSTSSCSIHKYSVLQIHRASSLDPRPINRRNGKRCITTRKDIEGLNIVCRRSPGSTSFRLLRPCGLCDVQWLGPQPAAFCFCRVKSIYSAHQIPTTSFAGLGAAAQRYGIAFLSFRCNGSALTLAMSWVIGVRCG